MSASPAERPRVLVTGASSQIGHFLLPRLLGAGYAVTALSRVPRPARAGLCWLQGDLRRPLDCSPGAAAPKALIHLALLSLLPERLPELVRWGVRRVVAFSSTSRFTKIASPDPAERALAASLGEAEDRLAARCAALGVDWTLFRPTLIYGAGMDQNVCFIAGFARRYRFFPLVGKGEGLRQPVHADDLADACLAVLDRPAGYGNAYQLSGGEVLSYRSMVERVFLALGQRPRLLPVPEALLRTALSGVRLLPGLHHLTPAMADRMSEDLCFDSGPARRDFGYAPRGFVPDALALGRAAPAAPATGPRSRG
jgi:nucleoside-diphosphate-sugar epimerase